MESNDRRWHQTSGFYATAERFQASKAGFTIHHGKDDGRDSMTLAGIVHTSTSRCST